MPSFRSSPLIRGGGGGPKWVSRCIRLIRVRDRWASAPALPRLPRSVQPEAFSMPADDGFGLHDHRHVAPVWQELRSQHPEQVIRRPQGWRSRVSLHRGYRVCRHAEVDEQQHEWRSRSRRHFPASYFNDYHRSRTHLSLGKDSPIPPPVESAEPGRTHDRVPQRSILHQVMPSQVFVHEIYGRILALYGLVRMTEQVRKRLDEAVTSSEP